MDDAELVVDEVEQTETEAATEETKAEEPKGYEIRNKELTRRLYKQDEILKQSVSEIERLEKLLKDNDLDEREASRASAKIAVHEERIELAKREKSEINGETFKQVSKEIPDFQQVVGNYKGPQLGAEVVQLINESDIGPHLVYEIAKNPDLAYKLNSLSPLSAAKEIARLETRIELSKSKQTPQKSAEVTPKSKGTPAAPHARYGKDWTLADEREYQRKLRSRK